MIKRITFEGFKDATISVTISNDGVEIMTNRGNKIDTMFLYWDEWNKVATAVEEAIKKKHKFKFSGRSRGCKFLFLGRHRECTPFMFMCRRRRIGGGVRKW